MLARTDLGELCAGLAGEPSRDEARWLEASVDGRERSPSNWLTR